MTILAPCYVEMPEGYIPTFGLDTNTVEKNDLIWNPLDEEWRKPSPTDIGKNVFIFHKVIRKFK